MAAGVAVWLAMMVDARMRKTPLTDVFAVKVNTSPAVKSTYADPRAVYVPLIGELAMLAQV